MNLERRVELLEARLGSLFYNLDQLTKYVTRVIEEERLLVQSLDAEKEMEKANENK